MLSLEDLEDYEEAPELEPDSPTHSWGPWHAILNLSFLPGETGVPATLPGAGAVSNTETEVGRGPVVHQQS